MIVLRFISLYLYFQTLQGSSLIVGVALVFVIFFFHGFWKWARAWQSQPLHPSGTLISLGFHPVWSELPLSAWRRFGSLATHIDAQTDLSLHWANRSLYLFCHAAVQLIFSSFTISVLAWQLIVKGGGFSFLFLRFDMVTLFAFVHA